MNFKIMAYERKRSHKITQESNPIRRIPLPRHLFQRKTSVRIFASVSHSGTDKSRPTQKRTNTPTGNCNQIPENDRTVQQQIRICNGKPDVNLIEYIQLVAANKLKQGRIGIKGTFDTLVYHLTKYHGDKIALQDIDIRYVKGFVQYLSTAIARTSGEVLKSSSQHNIYTSLKIIIHQAIKDELVTSDPTKSVDPPRMVLPHKEHLTEEELKRLIQTPCPKEMVKRSFLFCCFTGLRISDVQKLIWKEVVTTNNETYINFRQKKQKLRITFLCPKTQYRFFLPRERIQRQIRFSIYRRNRQFAKY